MSEQENVTQILAAVRRGDDGSEKELFSVVYEELRQMARARMAWEKPGSTLQTTALVHEAYMRLVGDAGGRWENRRHFFGAAAEAMRRILVDRARRVGRLKRGGDRQRVPLSDDVAAPERPLDIVAMDEALRKLQGLDPRKSQVVKLRFFLGLSVPETAEILEVSPRTVDNDWNMAKALLRREIAKGEGPEVSAE